jgi:hypothetical protein
MSSLKQPGNGHDQNSGPVAAGVIAGLSEESFNKPAVGPVAASKLNGLEAFVAPAIDPSVIWHFSVAGKDAKAAALEYGEQAWRAANRSPSIHDAVRDLRMRHAEEALGRITDELRSLEIFKLVVSSDQSGLGRDRHLRAMLWIAYGFIGVGFAVLNFTLSSYLLGSGMLDFAEHPFKAFAFCSLPITAALTLKALPAWMTERSRRRCALIFGATGGIIATIAWAGAFAWLFSPQSAAALTLPGGDGGIDFDKIIRAALVFMHIIGETFCAAALGLWAHKLAHRNARIEARKTEEFEICSAHRAEVVAELEALQAQQRDQLDYQQRFEAGLSAFKAWVGALFDAELRKREAAIAAATSKLLSAPGS